MTGSSGYRFPITDTFMTLLWLAGIGVVGIVVALGFAVVWAAEITAMIPPKQARRVIRREGVDAPHL